MALSSAALLLLLIVLPFGGSCVAAVLPTNARYWAGTAYLAVLGSVVTFPLYYRLIREIGAGRAAYHNVLVVIVAMGLSTLFEGYHWSALAIGGSALALVGMVIALRAKSV